MPKPKKSNQEASSATQKKLISAAIDLFSRKGFSGTSIRDIASEIGMTSSNMYHYFKTKDAVLTEIERQTIEPIVQQLRKIATLDVPHEERLTLLIRAHLEYLNATRKASRIFSFSEGTLPRNRAFQKESFAIYKAEIKSLLAEKGIDENPTILTFCALASIVWFLKWYRPRGKESLDSIIGSITRFILNGILGSKR
jgi:TetR/AcrR family transcriptional regulator, cholesterol catabolism regulator